MKKYKIAGLIVLAILLFSILAALFEINYCHALTTEPPLYAPADYIKGGMLCNINSYIAIPGLVILIPFLWGFH